MGRMNQKSELSPETAVRHSRRKEGAPPEGGIPHGQTDTPRHSARARRRGKRIREIARDISDPHRPRYYQLRAGSLSRATAQKADSGVFATDSLSPPPSAIPGPGECRMMAVIHIRIDAVDLPGLTCAAPADGIVPKYDNIHVAVQRRDCPAELLEPQPRDAPSATWIPECSTSAPPTRIEAIVKFGAAFPSDGESFTGVCHR